MIAVVQRVNSASVEVDGKIVGEIARGLAVLVAVEKDDAQEQVDAMAAKLAQLRLFPNADKNFDLDVKQVGGSLLMVSNFTVAADTRKGRRPSLDSAASPDRGRELFESLLRALQPYDIPIAIGQFQAHMHVRIENDGPVTVVVKT